MSGRRTRQASAGLSGVMPEVWPPWLSDVARTSRFPLIFWNCFTLFWFSIGGTYMTTKLGPKCSEKNLKKTESKLFVWPNLILFWSGGNYDAQWQIMLWLIITRTGSWPHLPDRKDIYAKYCNVNMVIGYIVQKHNFCFSFQSSLSNAASCLSLAYSISHNLSALPLACRKNRENVLAATVYSVCLQQHKYLMTLNHSCKCVKEGYLSTL